MNIRKLTVRERFRSFRHAVDGIAYVVSTQPNVVIIAAATVVVIAAGCWFRVSLVEWGLLAVAVFAVWMAETINTAIESLTDLASPDRHPLAKRAKDTAAGAVLLAAVLALILGVVVFLPRLIPFLG